MPDVSRADAHTVSLSNIVRTTVELADGSVTTITGGYLDLDVQDTMHDLFVNLLGAAAYCALAFPFLKRRGDETFSLARHFIPVYGVSRTEQTVQ